MAVIDEKKLIEELHILRDVMDFEDGQGFQKGFVAGVDKAIQSVVEMDRIENGLYEKNIPKKPIIIQGGEDVLYFECPMIDEKKLIEEIKSCTTRSELDGMREKVVEFWNQSKNISSYKLVRSEFIKAKDRIKRNGEGWYK